MPTQTDETDHDGGAQRMALLTTAVSLALLVTAGVWWAATSRGGTDGPNAQQQAAADAPPPSEETAGGAPAATVTAAPAKTPFYFLIVDSPARAAAVRERWNESNGLRRLTGSPELHASVVTVEPGDSAAWLYLAASDAASLGGESRLIQGLPPVEVIDLRESDSVGTASTRPSRCTPDCFDALSGLAELYRDHERDAGGVEQARSSSTLVYALTSPDKIDDAALLASWSGKGEFLIPITSLEYEMDVQANIETANHIRYAQGLPPIQVIDLRVEASPRESTLDHTSNPSCEDWQNGLISDRLAWGCLHVDD